MEEILKELHKKYFKWWLSISNNITHSPKDSEEIVLSAYMTAWLKKDTLTDRPAIKRYIELIVRTKSIDYTRNLRVYKIRNSIFADDFENLNSNTTLNDVEEIKENEDRYSRTMEIIYKIINSMDLGKRRDTMLLLLLGYDGNSIGRILNINPSTVYSHKSNGLKVIRKSLKRYNY